MDKPEQWLPVAGWEGFYSVSSHGRIRRDRFVDSRGRRTRGGFLAPVMVKPGYYQVTLCGNGKRQKQWVHRLVAEAFLTKPDGYRIQVNHKNAIKADNRLENIEWLPQADNLKHAWQLGLFPRGKRWRELHA